MPKSATHTPDLDLVDLCRRTIAARTKTADAGRLRVRIPWPHEQMRVVPGMHFHLAPELLLQISGRSTMTCPDDAVRFRAGEVCLIPRGVPHVESMDGGGRTVHNIVVAFHKRSLSIQVNCRTRGGRMQVRAFEHFECPHVRRLAEYLDDAVDAFHSRSPGRGALLKGALLAHLGGLQNVLDGRTRRPKAEPFKVAQCRLLVSQNLTDPALCVQQLADAIQCAPDYLSHLFRTEAGEPLVSYINRQRVDHAKRLLDSADLNISEVARASGYADPGYFARVFKRLVGETPREYRKRCVERL